MVLGQKGVVDSHLRRSKGRGGHKLERGVAGKLSGEPKEGLLKVVVGFGGNVVVLEVLLAVEGDGLGLDLALLDIDLVAAQNDRDVLADAHKISVPVGHVLVGDTRGDIEHDDAALAVNVVTVTETTKLLLASSVPDLKGNLTTVGVEVEGVNLDTLCGDVLLLEFTSQVALDKGSLESSC